MKLHFARSHGLLNAIPRHLRSGIAAIGMVLVAACMSSAAAQEARGAELAASHAPLGQDLGRLFDAVVATTTKSFWDKQRLSDWQRRAAEVRPAIVAAASLSDAADGINELLGELKTSHTLLLTPDDVDYYILLDVFNGVRRTKELIAERFWGAGVTFAGIGIFSVRMDGRDFVDAVLEGAPAERAGIAVGDEIVAVDGAPYHPIRSFRGKIGGEAAVTVRRSNAGAAQVVHVQIASIAPLYAFRQATLASARIIERDGRRIGYVHVWASVGEESAKVLGEALAGLGINQAVSGRSNFGRKGARLRPSLRAPVDGLIIDMRGKIGGTAATAGLYLDIIDPRGPLLRSRTGPATMNVRGRTAVLIDHHTRSTAELFAHAYQRERMGPMFGSHTAGAVSAGSGFVMPGGNLLYLAVDGLEVDGDVIEGRGVAPDVVVARPLAYARGADPVLEAAVEHLVRGAHAPAEREPEPNKAQP